MATLEEHWVASHPLAGEHAVLLQEVQRREAAVRTALGAGRWPAHEIEDLVAYLRYELLDQTGNEELLLFPRAAGAAGDDRVHGLVDDHARLRDMTDRLAATVPSEDADVRALVELLDDLEELLEQHMRAEQELLQALLGGVVPEGVEPLLRPFRCHLWFPLTEGPELDLDVLPRDFAIRAALERIGRLRPGENLVVRSSAELYGLWRALTRGRRGDFGWAYLDEGPEWWRAEVTRRRAG